MNYQDTLSAIAAAKARKEKRELKAKTLWVKGSKPPKNKKKPSITKLRKQVWDALSLYVRARDSKVHNGLCLICVTRPIEIAYHLIPANEGAAMKFDHEDVVGACSLCNFLEQNNRARYSLKHIELFGIEKMRALEAKSRTTVQYRRPDYEAMLSDFRARLAAINTPCVNSDSGI